MPKRVLLWLQRLGRTFTQCGDAGRTAPMNWGRRSRAPSRPPWPGHPMATGSRRRWSIPAGWGRPGYTASCTPSVATMPEGNDHPVADENYDVIVIGTSQGGRFLPADMAKAGTKVALVDRGHLGGVSVNPGCTPPTPTPPPPPPPSPAPP